MLMLRMKMQSEANMLTRKLVQWVEEQGPGPQNLGIAAGMRPFLVAVQKEK